MDALARLRAQRRELLAKIIDGFSIRVLAWAIASLVVAKSSS